MTTLSAPGTAAAEADPPRADARAGAGLLRVGLLMLVAPVAGARRSDALPLWQAWLVHAAGAGLMLFALQAVAGVGAAEPLTFAGWRQEVALGLSDLVYAVIDASAAERAAMIAGAVTGALMFEAFVVLAGVCAAGWAARQEPVAASVARGIRRVWLLTPHAAVTVLVAGLPGALADRLRWEWLQANDYSTAGAPWYVVWGDELGVGCAAAAVGWGLVVFLWSVSGGGWRASCRWPGLCEPCGYVLTGLPRGAACPECGAAVAASLDGERRPLVPWERRAGVVAWLATAASAIVRPSATATRLRVYRPTSAHRGFFAVTLVALALSGPVAVVAGHVVESPFSMGGWSGPRMDRVLIGGAWIGAAWSAATVAIVLGSASIMGIGARFYVGRNLLPGCMQAACYLSPVAWLVAASTWAVVVALIVLERLNLIEALADRLGVDAVLLVVAAVPTPFVLGLVAYVRLLGTMLYAMRNANA